MTGPEAGRVDVELWLIDARAPESAPGPAAAALDAEERERAMRFVHAPDRLLYQVAHVTLRQVLGARLGVAPAALAFEREPCPCCGALHGRPRVAAASLPPGEPLPHFSLSHGGDLVMLGLAAVPIGVDVERTASARAVGEVLGLLHPAEQRELTAGRPSSEGEAFSRVWARKEAYLKGLGTGLGRDLAEDYLGTTGAAPGPSGWTVLDIPAGPHHAAAVAVQAPAAHYTLRHSASH